MKKTSRLLILLLTLSLCIGLFTVSALAETETVINYNVWVLGTQVTSNNASDILDDGKVSYDPATNTLTVSRDLVATGSENAIKATTDDVLNIQAASGITISASEANRVIEADKGSAITTNGDISIVGTNAISKSTLTIKATGDVTIASTNSYITLGDLTVEGKKVTVSGNDSLSLVSNSASITATDDVSIVNTTGSICGTMTITAKNVTVSGNRSNHPLTTNATIAATGNIALTTASGAITP